jgi:hypothetical protein
MTDLTPSTEPALPTAFIASRQANGWSIDRQRMFCEALAECGYVEKAAALVGMTRQGAYAFKNSSAGRAFALAQEFGAFLDAMEAEANGARGATGEFMECRADWGSMMNRAPLKDSSSLLRRAALSAPEPQPRLEDRREA